VYQEDVITLSLTISDATKKTPIVRMITEFLFVSKRRRCHGRRLTKATLGVAI